jgi:hypothetical protein
MSKIIKLVLYFFKWLFSVFVYVFLRDAHKAQIIAIFFALMMIIITGLIDGGRMVLRPFTADRFYLDLGNWLLHVCCGDKAVGLSIAGILIFFALFAKLLIRLFFKDTAPYGALKAKYRTLYPKVNIVSIVPKTQHKGEDMESIISRLPAHLQELISKK